MGQCNALCEDTFPTEESSRQTSRMDKCEMLYTFRTQQLPKSELVS